MFARGRAQPIELVEAKVPVPNSLPALDESLLNL